MFSIFRVMRKARNAFGSRGLRALVGMPVLAMTLAACDPALMQAPTAAPTSSGAGKPVNVALLVPGGSANPGDALIARNLENAARLAIADLAGAKINLTVYNTAGNAAQASQVATQAVAEGAQVILGPLFSEAANAAGVAAAASGVNVLSFSNNTSIAGGNVFVLGNTFNNSADRLVNYARKQGKKRVHIVHARNVAGETGRAAIQQALVNAGVNLNGTTSYDFSQQGVINAVGTVSAAARTADAIILTSDAAGALPLFAQLLPEAGLNPSRVQYMGLTRWDIPQIMQLPGIQGGWFVLPDPGRVTSFTNRYQTAYGNAPHPLAGLAYDGIAAIGAISASGKAINGSTLTQGQGFQGTGGIFRLRANGTNQRGVAVATVTGGQLQILDPAPQSFGFGGS